MRIHRVIALAAQQNGFPALVLAALLLGLTVSPGRSTYNRVWHAIQVVPEDLQLSRLVSFWTAETMTLASKDSTFVALSPLSSEVQEAFEPSPDSSKFRPVHGPMDSVGLAQRLNWLESALKREKAEAGSASGLPQAHALSDARTLPSPGPLHQPDLPDAIELVRNSPESSASGFSSGLILVSTGKRYRVSSSIRQLRGPSSINYLAVTWYDQERRLLESHRPQPEGAGAPAGWSNGTYSYYGLVGQPAPAQWTSYSIVFGVGTSAAIPTNASFLEVGALLNYTAIPGAEVQIAQVSLQEILFLNYLTWLPSPTDLFTPGSQAAQLSGHWPDRRVCVDHGGSRELRERSAAANP